MENNKQPGMNPLPIFNKPVDVLTILTAYEGALQEANDDPDDDMAVRRLECARADLMKLLQLARAWEAAVLEESELALPPPMLMHRRILGL